MKLRWFIFFFLLFAILGYIREFFFVHLNIIMYEKYYHSVSPVPVPGTMNVFRHLSYDTLYYSKYFYTAIWAFLFFITGFFAVKKLGTHSQLIRIYIWTYVVISALAALSMLYGYFVNHRLQDDEYTLSRWLLGIAQSPIICLILVASEKLYNKSFQL